jgi:hypothetical protein
LNGILAHLKLDSDFIEGFCDNGNKYVLDHPRQEENHGDEVNGGFPMLRRISSSVHYVHPAFLTSS